MKKTFKINVTLEGTKFILFDRLVKNFDDKKVAQDLENHPEKKFYMQEDKTLFIPDEFLYSFFASKFKTSCVTRFGPQGNMKSEARRELAENILSFVKLSPNRMVLIRNGKPIKFGKWDSNGYDPISQATQYFAKAVIEKSKGKLIPNPITRPSLPLPWEFSFEIILYPNTAYIDPDKLYFYFEVGGQTIGIGAYRPRFGTFKIKNWDIEELD